MKVFVDEECSLHRPPYEILSGKIVAYHETPDRLLQIRLALEGDGVFQIEDADRSIDVQRHALQVHSVDYIEYLESAFGLWVEEGGDPEGSLFPETFPNAKITQRFATANLAPRSLAGKTGYYCFDLSCPITADTYTSVLASARVSLSAARELSRSGESAFALSRPPGHHAGTSVAGGYCFFNNVAIAAKYLQQESECSTCCGIAILDIDYHHGNGTQEIFYSDSSVTYVSLHAELDYPYFTGSREERGDGPGEGFNHNFPLPFGTEDGAYCGELRKGVKVIKEFDPAYLIVSLGVDTFESDPIGAFKLTTACYAEIGCIIRGLSKPTLFVLEGGYDLDTIGKNVRTLLEGFVTGAV